MTVKEAIKHLEYYKEHGYENSILQFRFYKDEEEQERIVSSMKLEMKPDGKDYVTLL